MASINERSPRITSTLIDHIDRVDLRVTDIDRSLGFYGEVVGLDVAGRDDRKATLRSPGGPTILALDSSGVTGPADRTATGLFHVAIRFPTRAALGDVLARLVHRGHRIGAGDHGVSEALYVDDPDGNGIELYWDRPRDQWPAPTDDMHVPMVTLPVDLESVLAEGRGAAAAGEPAAEGTDIGHIHLQVADVDRTTSFYGHALGLDVMARMGSQAVFMSSNGYHHHVGANTWNSRNGSPARSDRAGLDRVVFATNEAGLLDTSRTRLHEYGYEIKGEGNSLLVVDPDGVELEFVAI